nr:transposon Ty3-G Gag-Pol polyprotein [Tanacetum cinerariifolium]
MEPRPEPRREATPTLRLRSPRVRRQRERVVRFKDAPNREGNRRGRNAEGIRPLEIEAMEGFVHGMRTRILVEHLSTDLPSTYKGLMEKTYTWVEAREVATNGASNDQRDSFERSKKSSWDNNIGQRNKDRFFPYRGPNHGLLPSLSKSPKEILATEKAARRFEPPLKMFESKLTLAPRKRNKKERTKSSYIPRGESRKDKGKAPAETPILMRTIHGAIKFHTKKEIETVLLTNEANEGTKKAKRIPATSKERVLSCVNFEEKIIVNDKYPDQKVTIEKQLPDHFKKELQNLLKSNADVFAWTHAYMTGILRTIMIEGKPFNTEHKLNEYSHIKPIKQNKRGLGPDRSMAACKETEELTKAGILQKAKHQTWVANLVMVKKSDERWRMRRSILLQKDVVWYQNAGVTYQRLVDKVFSHQIRRNLEAYVDDIVIKSTSKKEMLKDIQETFERFRLINMKLNPDKCSFSVEEGPFLGHLITKHGIKANPSKVKVVTDLDQPRKLKDIQSLNGKLAALSRFLSKGAE